MHLAAGIAAHPVIKKGDQGGKVVRCVLVVCVVWSLCPAKGSPHPHQHHQPSLAEEIEQPHFTTSTATATSATDRTRQWQPKRPRWKALPS